METTRIIDAVMLSNPTAIKDAVGEILQGKAETAIANYKVELAKSMFTPVSEEKLDEITDVKGKRIFNQVTKSMQKSNKGLPTGNEPLVSPYKNRKESDIKNRENKKTFYANKKSKE